MPETQNWLDTLDVGVGCWQWGDARMWGYGKSYTRDDVRAAFEASLAAGVRFFDTAEVYGLGQSEKFLGLFMRERDEAGHPVSVATKFFPFPWRLSKGGLRGALRNSLRRLGLKQVDLYQVHMPFPPLSIETWMDAMADAVDSGLVRAVGVSNYDVAQTRRAAAALGRRGLKLASNQAPYSLLNRRVEKSGLLALCKDLGVRVIAYSPIEKGILSGKYTPGHLPPGLRQRIYSREYVERVQPLIALLRNLGQAHGGKTPAQVALNWAICKGALPIPGAKTAEQARQNAGALGWRLTSGEVASLDAASEQVVK